MSTSELEKLALNHGVKGLVLSHLLSARRGKEVMDADSKAELAKKAASDAEVSHAAGKLKLTGEIERLKKAREDDAAAAKREYDAVVGEMDDMKKRHAKEKTLLEKNVQLLTLTRNAFMVACFKTGKDLWDLQNENDDLAEANEDLKQAMADKYFEGFWSSVDQVKALFLISILKPWPRWMF
ncbi:hypothetical protein A2U01_0003245 [Trifolium medium]|uniref:Uncharacterized protein n=1 Tax=Trifolium medium TaxID=97028 RepID=A0A392M5A8_9FABA|nr:hypothetical protein [Trifolium medium]